MKEPTSGEVESCATCVPEATPGIGPEIRERLSVTVGLPRNVCRSSSSSSPDNKNNSAASPKGTPTFQQLERKVQRHMEIEDKRVGELAEGILYEFLPAAFDAVIPPCGDPRTELTHDRCKMVASAALSVGALMNAPPPFLEFLLRIPWQKIDELHSNMASSEWIEQQLEIPDGLRQELVNTPVHPTLIPTVLEFLFASSYRESVPPQLRSKIEPVPQNHLDKVAALLDGAGPLHCAAVRGNPAQIEHLLSSGADPFVKTVAGDLPIQLVPHCAEKCARSNQSICRCMTKKDQEIWECRSASARILIARKCIIHFTHGFNVWLLMTLLCILNLFGIWGWHSQLIQRKTILNHVRHQKEVKSTKAYLESKRMLNELRKEARQGQQYLLAARQIPWSPSAEKGHDHNSQKVEETATEQAFLSYVHAVHFLQNLLLHNAGKVADTAPPSLPKVTTVDCQVPEDEQSDIYCCWAESVLLKFKSCRCAGCAAVAVQAIRMAHVRCAQLLAQTEKEFRNRRCERWKLIGSNLMHIIYFHICLLLDTEARQSPTKASMWRAEQCVRECRRLEEKGLSLSSSDRARVAVLEQWVGTAESDLKLAEALYGDLMTPQQTVNEIVKLTVTKSPSGMRYHMLPATVENVNRLEAALNKAQASSSDLAALTVEIMQNGKKEIRAAALLKECLASKSPPVITGMIEKLAEAIAEAEHFPRLSVDVSAARQNHQQLLKRAEAIERLEVIMLQSKQPISCTNDAASGQDIDSSQLEERIAALQSGIEQGKKARINTEKAKKQLRELQLQMSVVESAHQLDAVMAKKHCGSGAIRTALTKAESCYSAASGHVSNGLISLSAFLLPRMQNARKRLEIERVMESLSRATTTCTTVDNLSKLEGIILDARKVLDEVGAEELDHKGYREARVLRGKLHNAAKMRQQLQNGIKTLQKQQRKADAVALEQTLQQAASCQSLIEADVLKAEQALEHWRCVQKREEHLNVVMKDAEESAEVAKAIHEAASAGVKTQSAKKVLKLMQTLETAMDQLSSHGTKSGHLKNVLEDAEKGGVSPKLTTRARTLLKNAHARQARELLVASTKEESGKDLQGRCTRLHQALKTAGAMIERSFKVDLTKIDDVDSTALKDSMRKMEHEEGESTQEVQAFWESVQIVKHEIRDCEAELARIKQIEAEKRARDLENDRKLREKRETERRQKEQAKKEQVRLKEIHKTEESKTKTKTSAMEAQELKKNRCKAHEPRQVEDRLTKLSKSAEKISKEKRPGLYRKPLVDPVTYQAVTQETHSPTASHETANDDGMAEMEYEVQRILDDDDYAPKRTITRAVSDTNKHVRGVLDALDDPWDIQSSEQLLIPPLLELPRTTTFGPPLPTGLPLASDLMLAVPPTTDPFELLLLQKKANDALRMQQLREAGDPRFAMHPPSIPPFAQPLMPRASWCPSLHSQRSVPLDSSAPAFYPTRSVESLEFPTRTPGHFRARPTRLEGQGLSSSGELQRHVEGPFPGVGAGIPGAPNRSLSERIDRSHLTRTLSDKE